MSVYVMINDGGNDSMLEDFVVEPIGQMSSSECAAIIRALIAKRFQVSKDPEPMFVMSMYANKEELYKAKAAYYMTKSERLEKLLV